MRPRLYNVLIPLTLLAATAVPSDPARAEGPACPRAAAVTNSNTKVTVDKAAKARLVVEKPRKEWQKLEAL